MLLSLFTSANLPNIVDFYVLLLVIIIFCDALQLLLTNWASDADELAYIKEKLNLQE